MSAPLWTAQEADAATGGRSSRAWEAADVSIDTRTLSRGGLFIALKGARDGHDFVADAFARGATAALVSRKPENVSAEAALLLVPDTQAGLEALGRASRARSNARIVAVTGSAGKTTTKEMLRLVLSRAGSTAASAASYNNQWGVPLSLARMGRDTRFGVFEIGMNHEGEIRALVKQVRPHVALVTTVAPAHLEYFGTVEKIADAKAEIFEGLDPGGSALLPADGPYADRLSRRAREAGADNVLTFGTRVDADARLLSARADGEGQTVTANVGGNAVAFRLVAPGTHIARNAVSALLAASELGVPVAEAACAIEEFSPLKGRGARFTVAGRTGAIEVIDESYNANPVSMSAALDLLAAARPRGRRIAALGDMLELGAQGEALHTGLAKDIEAAKAELVFLCGPQMSALWQVLPESRRGAYAATSTELAPQLTGALKGGDVVLVKGSFGSRMSVIIEALKALSSNGGGAAAA
ncbi:MAG: UDP-N-acetylmuramoylalanyl-D-glutamyl-2,6-diaminopimelate--D-alanyl-D-alanine ligase [Alphaproteobacteria bacterium]